MHESGNQDTNEGLAGRPGRGWWRWLLWFGVGAFTLVVGAFIVVLVMSRSEPAYWKEHEAFLEQTSPQEREKLAARAETRINDLLDGLVADADAAPATRERVDGGSALPDEIVTATEDTPATRKSASWAKEQPTNPSEGRIDVVASCRWPTSSCSPWSPSGWTVG